MPQLQAALVSFGQLLGLMDAAGTVQWMWFLHPLDNSLNGLPNNRQHLLALVRALLDRVPADPNNPPPGPVFAGSAIWEPINITSGLDAGLVWNSDAQPLQIGAGAKVALGSGKQHLDLALIVRLLKIAAGSPPQVTPEFGQFRLLGQLPVPDFLDSGAVDATINNGLTLGLDVVQAPGNGKHFAVPNNYIVWDCARLAIFVLRAWIKQNAQQGAKGAAAGAGNGSGNGNQSLTSPDNFYSRIDNHLFPMLGADSGPADPIQPFALLGDSPGTDPNFSNWQKSVFSFDNGPAGALTFLWHLRALITGNEDPQLFTGSYFFPLVGESPQLPTTPLPVPPFVSLGSYETTTHTNSVFVGITTEANGTTHQLVVDVFNQAGARQRIPLGQMNGSFTRPSLPPMNDAAWNTLTSFVNNLQGLQAGDSTLEVASANGGIALTMFRSTITASGISQLDGDYSLQLFLKPGAPVAFRMQTPLAPVPMELPPSLTPADEATLFVGILQWILSAAGVDQQSSTGKLIQSLLTVIGDAIATNNSPNFTPLVDAVLGLLGKNGLLDFGPVRLSIDAGAIEPTLSIGPLKPGDLANLPIHIGKFEAHAKVNLQTQQLEEAGLAFYDFRFGQGGGADATGLIGSLLPDMREVPGFQLSVSYDFVQNKAKLLGGGKVPIQATLGPLEVAGLLIDLRDTYLRVGVDLSFKLAVILVTAYELGVEFPFSGGAPTPFLNGLGVSMDIPAVKLAGMFARVKTGPDTSDFIGGAVVRILNLFQVSAIGGYTQLPGDTSSLFIFASLVAPLGGPPWFFITGIAGGFGYNRTLPPPGLLTKHPFIQIMRGDLPISADSATALTQLGSYFQAVNNQHWVAGGIQFTAFGFINGKIVVAIGFGNKFTVQVLGLAAFGIEHIAYFELGLEATGNEELFKLKAGLSKNSYLIHPDIASLTGDFGLGIWHGGEHAGDFVLSIGGYHPYFKKPEHYDDLSRVAVRCIVYGFIRLAVECFFACTPQALMAGASCSLSAEFAGIGCGLDVYIDVFIRWDPFFMQARMGVALWFEFWGRHEIGVDLEIWTPPFGGKATIDLALVSFDVDFGHSLADPPPPKLHQFLTRQLGVPATRDGEKAVVPAFNSDSQAGLFRLDFLYGRNTKPQANSPKQEGLDAPVSVSAEFGFLVKTKLPLNYPQLWDPGQPAISGKINVPLCELFDLSSGFNVTAPTLGWWKTDKYLKDMFPSANFGGPVSTAQADQSGARHAVGAVDTSKPSIALWDAFSIRVEANLGAAPPDIASKQFEDSAGDEEYPLPLRKPADVSISARGPKSRIVFKDQASFPKMQRNRTRLTSREQADIIAAKTKPGPLRITQRMADLQRFVLNARLRGLSVSNPPTDAPVVGVPSSPSRRPELYPVSLRILAPKAPIDLRRTRLRSLSRAGNLVSKMLTPRTGALGPWKGAVQVAQRSAQVLDLADGDIKSQKLTFTGTQTVRAVFLGSGDDFLKDVYVAGAGTITAPGRARRIALIGEGALPPIAPSALAGPPVPTAQENIGVEHDTTLLALGRRTFAGHGCVVECKSPLSFRAQALDSVPGFQLLRSAVNFRVSFPAGMKNAALVFTVAPANSNPGVALDEVRWVAIDATLSDLTTIVGAEATAFVMTINAGGPWWLELDLGPNWRVTQVVAVRQSARDTVNLFRTRIEQDLTDDRFQFTQETTPSSVTLEVTQ